MKLQRTTWLCVAVILVGLLSASGLNQKLLRQREAHGLVLSGSLEGAPPHVVFTTVALGGFRGLLADVLWLRISSLQEQARYFELVQLADWVTRLVPHNAEIWTFHAWNLAYNISVMMPRDEDRWRWVKHGLELLRDQGIVFAPGEAKLYTELGWIYQHKLGSDTDQAHTYYRLRLNDEMSALPWFEDGRPDYGGLVADPEAVAGLRRTHRLDVTTMQAIEARYGPLDWRLPHTHAIYWAFAGLSHAKGFDSVRCHRMIYQSLMALTKKGHLTVDPDSGEMTVMPRPEHMVHVRKALDAAIAAHPEESTFREARYDFLRASARLHADAGEDERAHLIHAEALGLYPDITPGYEPFIAPLEPGGAAP